MKILVLGSRGFIGSHLVDHFLDKGYLVYGCDVIEYSTQQYNYSKLSILSPDFDTFFYNQRFDFCINASGSGNVSYSIEHPYSDFEANTIVVAKLLDAIRKCDFSCNFLHISSAAVYGNPNQIPINEGHELMPLSPYGFHKVMSETVCKEYHLLYKLPITIVRPFSVFGAGLKKQLYWDLCNKLKASNSVQLFGTGNESRDFIHVSDLCRLINIIVEKDDFSCNIYNAAGGSEKTIREIADIFSFYYGNKKEIIFNGHVRCGDPLNWRADVNKISKLGFAPAADFRESTLSYINWFESLRS